MSFGSRTRSTKYFLINWKSVTFVDWQTAEMNGRVSALTQTRSQKGFVCLCTVSSTLWTVDCV